MSDKIILNSLLADICGVSRIESEDPRWIQLFSTAHMLLLVNEDLPDKYCDLLMINNKTTGNFVQLLEHTSSRISQISATKLNPNGQSIDQCCMALYLSTILFQYLIASLSSTELRLQLFLPTNWPITTQDSSPLTSTIDGLKVVESLLDELVIAIDQPQTSPWMHDVKFFCTNMLLTLASTQLYQNADLNGSVYSMTGSVDDDLFLAYLYSHAEHQLRDALRNGSSYSSAFSSSTGVRLVRGLFVSGLLETEVVNTDVKIQTHSSLLAALQEHYLSQNSKVLNRTNVSVAPSLQPAMGSYWSMITSPILTMQQWWQGQLALLNSRRGLLLTASPAEPFLTGGGKQTGAVANKQRILFPTDPLVERSLNLLLVLLHNNRSAASRNPFREVFGMLQDDSINSSGNPDGGVEGDVELMSRGKGALLVSSLHVDFRRAIRGLESNLPSETSALLLYSLLHSHPTFADVLLVTDSAHLLLDRCLHGLHSLTSNSISPIERGEATPDCQSSSRLNRMYILVICLLLVLQDGVLMARLVSIRVQAPWYKERQLHNIAVLDLVTLCTLRSVMHAVFRAKDTYLLGNCCAVLHNVSTQVIELHPYTSERIVKMLYQLAGRIVVWADAASDESSLATAPRLLVEAFCSLVRFVATSLRISSRLANVHLLYALIHDFELIERNLSAPGLIRVLVALGDHFDNVLQELPRIVNLAQLHLTAIEHMRGGEDGGNYFSADQAITSLRKSLMEAKTDSMSVPLSGTIPLESYCYQEAERPEDFFVPCVWTAAIGSSPEVAWRLVDIALFNPFAAGFLRWQSSDGSLSSDVVGSSMEDQV